MPLARREALLDEFEKSGMNWARFAWISGIKCATFAVWVVERTFADSGAIGGSTAIANAKPTARQWSIWA
jgi:hypothetical protein